MQSRPTIIDTDDDDERGAILKPALDMSPNPRGETSSEPDRTGGAVLLCLLATVALLTTAEVKGALYVFQESASLITATTGGRLIPLTQVMVTAGAGDPLASADGR